MDREHQEAGDEATERENQKNRVEHEVRNEALLVALKNWIKRLNLSLVSHFIPAAYLVNSEK